MKEVLTSEIFRVAEELPVLRVVRTRPWLLRHAAFILAALVVLSAGFAMRITSSMDRPLEFDEISPLISYTSVGYISKISELREKKRFQLGDTIKGIVRCFGSWKGPSNNIINNVGLSIYTFFFGFSERSLRGFAMISSLMLAVLLMYWIYRYCDSVVMATIGGGLLLAHPYFMRYGQMARGYAFSSMLIMIDILAIEVIRKRKQTIWTVGFLAFLNYAIFLDLVSSIFVWLAPLYLCAIWGAGESPSAARGAGGMHPVRQFFADRKRQGWILQAVALALMTGEFVLTHFRAVVGSQSKFGISMQTSSEIPEHIRGLLDYMFPYTWPLAAVLGVAGWCMMMRKRTRHWLAPVVITSVACCLIYAAGTRKLPYERTFGFYVILVVMGIAWLWKSVDRMGAAWRTPARTALVAALTLVMVTSGHRALLAKPDIDYTQCAAEINGSVQRMGDTADGTLVLLPYVYAEEMRLYLPDDNRYLYLDDKKKNLLNVYIPCHSNGQAYSFRCQYYKRSEQEFITSDLPSEWLVGKVFEEQNYAVFRVPMRVRRGGPIPGQDEKARLVIWMSKAPYFDLSAYVGDELKWNMSEWLVKFVPNSFMHPQSLVFFVSNAAQMESVRKILTGLESEAFGEVYTLSAEPETTAAQPLHARR